MLQSKLPSSWVSQQDQDLDSDELFSEGEEIRKSEVGSMWTRVKSVTAMKSLAIHLYDLDKDITADIAVTRARKHISGDKGSCIFDPKEFDGKLQSFQLNKYTLPDNELRAFAEMATKVRKKFEVDETVLTQTQPGSFDTTALNEVKRVVKL